MREGKQINWERPNETEAEVVRMMFGSEICWESQDRGRGLIASAVLPASATHFTLLGSSIYLCCCFDETCKVTPAGEYAA